MSQKIKKTSFIPLLKPFIVILALYTSQAMAEKSSALDYEFQTLLAMNLEKLATISIASKREERIEEAPGIVTVITAEEIQRFGARNLRDVLDRQTNMQTNGSHFLPHNRTTMRGMIQTHSDNNILLLLNGRPIRESHIGGLNTDIYNLFPLEFIERIEIIRGPGSVLYGTNAFAGAINLLTKKAPKKTNETEVAISYGSFDRKQGTISSTGQYKDLHYAGSFKLLNTPGDDFDNFTFETGETSTYKSGKTGIQAVVTANYNGFYLDSIFTRSDQDSYKTINFSSTPTGNLDVDREFIDIGYRHDLTSNWNIEFHASLNQLRFEFPSIPATNGRNFGDSDGYLLELTTHGKLADDVNLIAGGTFDVLRGRVGTAGSDYSVERHGLYMQLDYQPQDWLKLIGGFQWNNPEESSSDISLRFGLITNFDNGWGTKLLYGEAFRSPFGADLFLNAPAIMGNPQLKPEKLKTIDAQVFYNSNKTSFALTAYYTKQTDLHTRTNPPPPLTFVNQGEIDYYGFEFEGKTQLTDRLNLIGNASFQTNENDAGNHDATISNPWMLKAGLLYESPRGYSLGIFNSYFAEPTQINEISTNTISNVNPEADGYNLLTANINLNLGQYFQNNTFDSIELSVFGDNLLDEDIFFPDINAPRINSIPLRAGRGFYGTINVVF